MNACYTGWRKKMGPLIILNYTTQEGSTFLRHPVYIVKKHNAHSHLFIKLFQFFFLFSFIWDPKNNNLNPMFEVTEFAGLQILLLPHLRIAIGHYRIETMPKKVSL